MTRKIASVRVFSTSVQKFLVCVISGCEFDTRYCIEFIEYLRITRENRRMKFREACDFSRVGGQGNSIFYLRRNFETLSRGGYRERSFFFFFYRKYNNNNNPMQNQALGIFAPIHTVLTQSRKTRQRVATPLITNTRAGGRVCVCPSKSCPR